MIQRSILRVALLANLSPVIRAASAAAQDVILARFPAQALTFSGSQPPTEIMVMPGGVHLINAFKGDGQPVELHVKVDRETAAALQQALSAHLADGPQRPYFDFDHDETSASFWPSEFIWKDGPAPGVYARGEWSAAGSDAVTGKTYRSFSPSFNVDRVETTAQSPAKVIGSPFIMGGLVNNPAFKNILPLWARSADTNPQPTRIVMNEIEQLKAALARLLNEINAIKAKTAPTADEASALKAKESEAESTRLKIENAELKASNAAHEERVLARRKEIATDAIAAATARGVFPAQPAKDSDDEKEIARWRQLIEADSENASLLARLAPNPALGAPITTATTRTGVSLIQPEIANVVRAYNAAQASLERGQIYARDLRSRMNSEEGTLAVLRAANSLGTLSGTLIVQKSLDLLKISFPVLSRISTNYADLDGSVSFAKLNQPIITRLISVPSVGTYDPDNGGYANKDAVGTDVPVTIDSHKFTQVSFNANEIASTSRLLFGENEEAMHYALGKDLIDAIYALFIAANYTEAPTIKALVDMNRTAVIKVGTDMQVGSANRNANTGTRTLLLASDFYGKLAEDITIVSPLYNSNAGQAIAQNTLPMVHGFLPVEAPNLPNTANLKGVGLRADAVALALRPANDYTTALPGLPATGIVQMVTNPDTGLTVTLVMFVNHATGTATMRVAWMRGVAKGNIKAGQLLKSA